MTPCQDPRTKAVIGVAIEVHRQLGPGLLETHYRECLAHELRLRGHRVEEEVSMEVQYKGLRTGRSYRADLVVDGAVLVELKAVRHLDPVHRAQVLSYLRISGLRVGLLINFNVRLLKHGICRLVMDPGWRTSRNHRGAEPQRKQPKGPGPEDVTSG